MMTTTLLLAAALTVDFSGNVGKIRPELHSSGFGPTICSQTPAALADLKAMGFKASRTHDWAACNRAQRACDYFFIFPLMHLDAKDPKNYYFEPTDYVLKRTREEMGTEVFFRLGTTIEHSGPKVHFNARVPEDFDKVAESFAGTVRHYNRGWANGFNWGIKYWEIWNEPDGDGPNMWCAPEGIEGLTGAALEAKKTELRKSFIRFFVICLKRLKSEFGDSIKVGGPALSCYRPVWLEETLAACREAGVVPDFISWHGYQNDPLAYSREAELIRATCDRYGFTKCELILNEWHYFGENMTWEDLQWCYDPAVKARVHDGPDGINGSRSACFTLATLANMQVSKINQAFFYGCGHVGNWGFKDPYHRKHVVFYALKLFGDIVRDYRTICGVTRAGTLTAMAMKDAKGKPALLLIDYGGATRTLAVDVKGLPAGAKPKAIILDQTHHLEPGQVALRDGVLSFVKNDFDSAAFFVTFE